MDLWGRRSFEFIHKLDVGRAGGILVAWDSSVFEVINHQIGEFSVSILGKNRDDGMLWAFKGVYGSCNQAAGFGLLREGLAEFGLFGKCRGVLGVIMLFDTPRNV